MKLTKIQKEEGKIAHDLYWEIYLKAEVRALSSSLKNQYSQISLEKSEVSNKKEIGNLVTLQENLTVDIKMHNRISKIDFVDGFAFFKEHCDVYVFKELKWTFFSNFIASSVMQKKENGWSMIHHQFSMPNVNSLDNHNIQTEEISGESIQNPEVVKS